MLTATSLTPVISWARKYSQRIPLASLKPFVEKKAEFKPWGPFSDIEIMDWEGFIPDMHDAEYLAQLKARMMDRVNEIEEFSVLKDGYDKLPDDALAAIKKVVDELN